MTRREMLEGLKALPFLGVGVSEASPGEKPPVMIDYQSLAKAIVDEIEKREAEEAAKNPWNAYTNIY
jgi:hypothetical protein